MIKKVIKNKQQLIYYLLVGIFCLIFAVLSLPNLNFPGGVRAFTVTSGSMAPSLSTGEVVIIKPFDQYQVGDIIIFYPFVDNQEKTITHRIYGLKETNGKELYITKGDASNLFDAQLVAPEAVLGKVVFSVPHLGGFINFVKPKKLLRVLIFFPAALIVFIELVKIKEVLDSDSGEAEKP